MATSETPAEDLVTALSAAVAALTEGTNLWPGPMRKYEPGGLIPAEAVFVLDVAGEPPISFADGGAGGEMRKYGVQVLVRSEPNDFAGGILLARSTYDAIHGATVTNYYRVECSQAGPTHLGTVEAKQHLWSINATLWA